LAILLVALSLSIGWGVRGNWGHEYGAMIPGALAAIAAVVVSGRQDWFRRVGFFGFFGAVGWSFGGSISYMKVIAYTHSGHTESVFYGFACLFLIGFIWAAFGGAGSALPAFLDRARLTELLIPTLVVFAAWLAQDQLTSIYLQGLDEQVAAGKLSAEQLTDQTAWMNWHDSDWLGVIVAAGAVLLLAVVRNRFCFGTSLVLHMCAGWWLGFTILAVGLGLHMTPPRGDNWAGALGMMIGMFAFLYRQQEWGVAWSAVLVGLFGGLGFSGSALIKLVLMHPGFQERLLGVQVTANWHSVLEQTFGFISGIGVALALGYLSTHTPRVSEEPPVRTWAEPATILFVLLAVTYVNIVKNVDKMWIPHKVVADHLLGIATITWFNLAYAVLAVAVAWPLIVACRGRSLDILPASRLGKAQLLFVVLLWWVVIGNFTRMVDFQELRLVTEGVVHFNACVCTLLVLLLPRPERTVGEIIETNYLLLLKRFVASAILMSLILIVAEGALTQALWADGQAPHARRHIRFGPDNTNVEHR